MMNKEQIHAQQLRLKNVTKDEWEVALDALTVEMSKPELLGGQIIDGPHDTKRLVNGKTRYGAHSEYNLATSNVLYHYQAEFLLALYDGKWEWKEGVSLADQLIEIANSRIPKVANKYIKKKERELQVADTLLSEVVEKYTSVVKRLGGEANAKWVYSLVMYNGKNFHDLTWEEPVLFSDTPHYPITRGYVLNNITIVKKSDGDNVMLSDLDEEERYKYLSRYTDAVVNFIKDNSTNQ